MKFHMIVDGELQPHLIYGCPECARDHILPQYQVLDNLVQQCPCGTQIEFSEADQEKVKKIFANLQRTLAGFEIHETD